MGYLIFAETLLEILFSLVRIVLFLCYYKFYVTFTGYVYGPYTLYFILINRIPISLWLIAQINLFSKDNDCYDGMLFYI